MQLLHECPECGWTSESNKCCQLCPVCSSLDVINRVNKDGDTVNDDDDYKHWTVSVYQDQSFFSELRCGFAR
jgi:hypothetical protein